MAVATVLAVAELARLSGTVKGMVATLVVIGFSPDRSELIASLTIEAVAVAIGAVVAPRRNWLLPAGVGVLALLYHRTFDAETGAALGETGASGRFDPVGWALTLGTLIVTAIVIAWAMTNLTAIVRTEVGRAVTDLRSIRARGLGRRTLTRPVAVAVVAAVLVATLPLLGDMLNYEPDIAMRAGGPAAVGLAQTGPEASVSPALPTLPPSLLNGGGVIGPGSQPGVAPPNVVLSTARPWLAWVPTGTGTIVEQVVPAPFGPPGTTTSIEVYLPPGYQSSNQRYPVLYEVPWNFASWEKGVNIEATLDTLIDRGTIPSTIVAFVHESGGPYPDTECANSIDGRIWFERWIVQTVVPIVDQTYRTIPKAAARGVMGFSQGGFCAPMLVLKDPTIFGTAISYAGYFQAGIRSGQTVNAWIPFGGSSDYERLFSPIDLASQVAPSLRPFLFIELSSNPLGPFYGPQYVTFSRVLAGAGIPVDLFPNPIGHAWAAIRVQLPQMLGTWGARMAALSALAS